MREWHVYLNGELIDTVFYDDDISAEEVKRGLVEHDGYDSGITVSQDYELNLRNFQGDILNTFRGTKEQILAQMKEQLDEANYIMWSGIIEERLKDV